MKDIDGPLCVGNIYDALDSVKLRIILDAANHAYENAFELYGENKKAFKEGKSFVDKFILPNISSDKRKVIKKEVESYYRKLWGIKRFHFFD